MRNPYIQALATYPRRVFSSWWIGGFLVVILLFSIGLIWDGHGAPAGKVFNSNFVEDNLIACFLINGFLWWHLREQLVQPERHLIPGFLRPHLFSFALISMLQVIAWSAVFSLALETFTLSLLAVSAAIFALVGWVLLAQSPWLIFVSLAAVTGMIVGINLSGAVFFLTEVHALPAMAISAGSVLAAIAAIRWRCGRRDGYSPPTAMAGSRQQPRVTGNRVGPGGAAPAGPVLDWLFYQKPRIVPNDAGIWGFSHAWCWRMNRFLQLLIGSSLAGMLIVKIWERIPLYVQMQSAVVLLLLWPIWMFPIIWHTQWRYLEADSMRPLNRKTLLKILGLGIARSYAQMWAIVSVLTALGYFLHSPPGLGLSYLAILLVAILAFELFSYAICIWFLRYRSQSKMCIGLLIPLAIVFCSIVLPDGLETPEQRRLLLLAPALLLAAILIARDAWRRWLVTELG